MVLGHRVSADYFSTQRDRGGARQLFEDSPSFSTPRTCAVSNGTGAAAATVLSSADIEPNGGYSR